MNAMTVLVYNLTIVMKGLASDVSNYRPISITCICCKMLETIVKNNLLSYLEKNRIISKSQHGFLKAHSTSTNILESLNDWTLQIDNRGALGVAYIDFSKAFDSVSHPKLLHKLQAIGIGGKLLSWISSFLSSRFQSTFVGAARSPLITMSSGVPQGSVLGPLLFVLYVNEIAELLKPCLSLKMFADDVKLYSSL